MQKIRALLACHMLALVLTACSECEGQDRFEATGEIIALGGADAGPAGACVTCHGLQGEGDGDLVPRLAALDRGYFLRQLEYFARGQRRHPQMASIAGHLDGPARERVAQYYADLPVPDAAASALAPEDCTAAALYHDGDPERGLTPCAECHGADGAGLGGGNPPLAAQPAPYLEAQLRAWAAGERYGDPGNVMLEISRLLTEAEMARLAGYSSALPGADGYPEPRAACPRAHRPGPRNGA